MPNHVTNILRFLGDAKEIERLLEHVQGEETAFDFNTILPCPKSLNITATSISSNDPAEIDKCLRERNIRYKWGMSEETLLAKIEAEQKIAKVYRKNLEEYGATNWYDWNCHNWGTKWNAYSIDVHEQESISFDTAWSTPVPIIEALSRIFPTIELTVEYADEDIGNNCGTYGFENGESIGEWHPSDVEATKFAMGIKNPDHTVHDLADYGMDENYEYIEDED